VTPERSDGALARLRRSGGAQKSAARYHRR
jgi:hypothetical protein